MHKISYKATTEELVFLSQFGDLSAILAEDMIVVDIEIETVVNASRVEVSERPKRQAPEISLTTDVYDNLLAGLSNHPEADLTFKGIRVVIIAAPDRSISLEVGNKVVVKYNDFGS